MANMIVKIVVGNDVYYVRSGPHEWILVPRPDGEMETSFTLPQEHVVVVEVPGPGPVEVKLDLRSGYVSHARWLVLNEATAEDCLLMSISHVAGYLAHAFAARDKTLKCLDWLERIDPEGIFLPGDIYEVASLRFVDSPAVTTRVIASEGL